MRKILMLLSISSLLMVNSFAVMLTLEEAIKSAKNNSDKLKIEEYQLASLKHEINQYRTGLLPTMSIVAAKTQSHAFDSSWEQQANDTYLSKLIKLETERYDLKLVGEYKLIDLAFISKHSAMMKNYEAAYADYNQTVADLEFEIISIYYHLLLEEQLKNILEEEIEILDQYLKDLKLKVDLQYIDKQSFLNSQINLQDKKQELYKARKSYFKLKMDFASLLGIPGSLKYEISSFEEIFKIKAEHKNLKMFENLLEEASLSRYNMESLNWQREALEKEIKALKTQTFMPEITANASYGYLNENEFSNTVKDEYWTVGIQANLQFFTGFFRKNKIKEINTKIDIIDQNFISLEKDIKISKMFHYLENLYEVYKGNSENLEILEKNLMEIQNKYRFKEAKKEDLLSVQLAYNSAKKQYLDVKIDLLITEKEYDYILGRLNKPKY
ncbi:MAG: TolC family protein [Bacteroidetes bacterium]|nr:TolC family protein [Bacteroidota bacterium]